MITANFTHAGSLPAPGTPPALPPTSGLPPADTDMYSACFGSKSPGPARGCLLSLNMIRKLLLVHSFFEVPRFIVTRQQKLNGDSSTLRRKSTTRLRCKGQSTIKRIGSGSFLTTIVSTLYHVPGIPASHSMFVFPFSIFFYGLPAPPLYYPLSLFCLLGYGF